MHTLHNCYSTENPNLINMISRIRALWAIPFIGLLVACSNSYPTGVIQQLEKDGLSFHKIRYYSPSIVETFASLDSTGTLAPIAMGIYDVLQLDIDREHEDSTFSSFRILEEIDALEFETILPPMYEGTSSTQILGRSVDNKLQLILLVRQTDETFSVVEIRGDNLRNNLSRAMMMAMMNRELQIPFFQ